jgi:hypothetical protein
MENSMKRAYACVAVLALLAICSAVYALYSVSDTGDWPKSWSKELDPFRKTSKTYVGPMMDHRHYLIPFTNREQFEMAWPHFVSVKSKGAPIILVRGPKTDFMEIKPAGVLIHSPPAGSKQPEEPVPGQQRVRSTWMNTTFIELVVDGNIVDLNRLELPKDTPIVDERFLPAQKEQGR